ncbi:MAG TPA: LD-carboxypeptidase [Clostridiales bacterium]|nr:LD-carboxypeptidase [Clostridiales bacterium]
MIKPKQLKKGDCIGLLAPSGPVDDTSVIHDMVEGLKNLGFFVKEAKCCYEKYGYLAGKDQERADDVNSFFQDKSIDGILCMKGGYGASRILDLLDYDAIAKNPKVFIGYSDITALHLALNKKCRMVTFHGPVGYDVAGEFDAYTKAFFLKAVMSDEPIGQMFNPQEREILFLYGGKAKGSIIGGNLSLVAGTIGTPYEIDTKGKLLLLEDIGEEPYRVDRMLMQLQMSGMLSDCNGIILGDWKNCDPEHPEKSLSLNEIFTDILLPLRKPIIHNVAAGHCKQKLTVPFGVEALLDADACTVTVTESAVIK